MIERLKCKNVAEAGEVSRDVYSKRHRKSKHHIIKSERGYHIRGTYDKMTTWLKGYDEVAEDSILISFRDKFNKFVIVCFNDGRIIDNIITGTTAIDVENEWRDKRFEEYKTSIQEHWEELWDEGKRSI